LKSESQERNQGEINLEGQLGSKASEGCKILRTQHNAHMGKCAV